VQAIHAAHDAGRFFCGEADPVPSVVVCRTPSEESLLREFNRLDCRGIRTTLFREPDRNNEATALATEPLGPVARRTFSKWKLWE
jgi:hypothetical protein